MFKWLREQLTGEPAQKPGSSSSAARPPSPAASTAKPAVIASIEPAKERLLEAETVYDCVRAFINAPASSELEQRAIDKIGKIAQGFDDWLTVYRNVGSESKLGKIAADKLKSSAKTLYELGELDE